MKSAGQENRFGAGGWPEIFPGIRPWEAQKPLTFSFVSALIDGIDAVVPGNEARLMIRGMI